MTFNTLPNGLLHTPPQKARVRDDSKSSDSPWVVQKFGGTSVGKFPDSIVEIVKAGLLQNQVAVVCSARSTGSKATGTTNRLLRAAREAQTETPAQFRALINDVRKDHIREAEARIRSAEIRARVVTEVEDECSLVTKVLEAAQTLGEISPRSVNKVISTGEKLSCRFMVALLQDNNVEAQYIDLSEIIDFPVKGGLDQQFYDQLTANMGRQIQECAGRVPVITGYFGTIPGGLLERVGRGYTDLCAALVAVGVRADELQVWKEVDGIFTADPRKVPTARMLPQITPAEASELTFYGSEVIHPFTMEQVIRARIPIRIKNVKNARGNGTVIFPDSPSDAEATASGHDPRLFRTRSSSLLGDRKHPKRPTAVTIKHKILVINVHSNKRSLSHGFFANIFSTLHKWRLSIDLISTSEVHVSMALHSEAPMYSGGGDDEYQIVDRDLRGAIDELKTYGTVDIIPEMAILSLVGKQMKNMIGIAGKMFSTLGENNVNIEMISQGASEINISCVIESRDADRAINILHTNLFTFLES